MFHTAPDAFRGSSWIAIAPALLVLVLLASHLPNPLRTRFPNVNRRLRRIGRAFTKFLPLHEAEALVSPRIHTTDVVLSRGRWRSVLFAFLGILEVLAWAADASFYLVVTPFDVWGAIVRFLIAFSWVYATVRPITRPSTTVPYDLCVIYLLHFIVAFLQLGGALFNTVLSDIPLPSTLAMFGLFANLGITTALVYVTMRMPIGLPSTRVKEEDIGHSVSPEDYTSLFGLITFNWVYTLIQRGANTALEEKDVWALSPTLRSRAIFTKFYQLQSATLLRRIWDANSLDILLDFFGTLGSVVFAYGGPFFLKRLLDAIDHPDPTSRDKGMAYNYAGLMFICALLKAQFDAQHLWYGTRASTRIRTELMAAIYDKALKRKDFSGVTKKNATEPAVESTKTTAQQKAKPKEDENQATAGADIGKIVNLMSSDAEKIARIVNSMYFVYGAPLEFAIGFTFLYQLLGWSAFSGFIAIVAGIPLNNFLAERNARINKGILAAKDERMEEVNELLGAIKFVKFFSWEEMWIGRAMKARNEEMAWRLKGQQPFSFVPPGANAGIRLGRLNNVLFQCVWSITPILLSIISFFTYVWLGNELTIAKAFTALTLFAMIRAPLNLAPMYLVEVIQARIAINRIAVFLGEAEVSEQTSSLKQDNSEPMLPGFEDDRLGLENASFKWNEIENADEAEDADATDDITVSDVSRRSLSDHRFELKDISVLFPKGVLTVVTGPTARSVALLRSLHFFDKLLFHCVAVKLPFLQVFSSAGFFPLTEMQMAVLGEMTMLPGGRIIMSKNPSNIDEHGNMHTISYVARTPWLRNETIRENILFGYPWDEQRYHEVLECCALNPDLEVLEDGDATEIGAKGISLSGGQKARVALARACYARTKWVLLDDPLSAVDSHTARFLYDRLLCGPLLANRTVILVTHHVELVLPGANYLIRMKDGRIDSQGSLEDLRSRGILEEITEEAAQEVTDEDPPAPSEPPEQTIEAELDAGELKTVKEAKKPRKLVEDEHRETGSVKWSVYKTYLAAAGYWVWGLFVFLALVVQLKAVAEKIWIKIWGEAYEVSVNASAAYTYSSFGGAKYDDGYVANAGLPHVRPSGGWPSALERPLYYAGIYTAIGFFGVTVHLLSVAMEHTAALNAARRLYRRLLESVVRATFRFHDTTPLGRMLNRFGRDVEIVDNEIAWKIVAFTSAVGGFFVSVITVLFVFPLFVVPAAIIGYFYPFSAEKRLLNKLYERLDSSTQLSYAFDMTNRWLLLNFDFLGSISAFTTACFAVTFLGNDAGLAGLAITSALNFSQGVHQTLRFWTALELELNCVERIVEYLYLPQEPPAIIESYRPPAYWPSTSRKEDLLTLENVVVKYAPDLPAVLHGISFSLKAGERVGLVGRTGSGKSTLATTLLRFVDPSSGKIIIDGIDISKIGLYDLRSRITFIPQDAALFSGTLRDNLDPFGEYEDSVCMNVLYRVHLISPSQNVSRSATPYSTRPPSIDDSTTDTEVDAKTIISLDTQVSAGGANFSQGQKQLIALARALLRRSTIVILDEATSSVDFETDAKIQTAIREEFTGSLLITVAHRLRSIMDYDRIIVLDNGRLAEMDTPLRLMDKENGIFRTMCLRSGSYRELEAMAQAKEDTRIHR
ncbi:putative multidrug resistance-associated ABC transporter [Mycena venus]|uniref:Putative multidrug resistance-associated ABC transporter n=1 Tax=Mycena venus TaxID=2733690 RepID=A0A8H6YPZ1_9AGAR|nr:putative multidrug resistance-associated ABC transporter [Mycena venus]